MGNAILVRINFAAGTPTTTSLGSFGFLSNGALAGDASGNLYATAGDIAASGYGSLFRVSTSGGAGTSLSQFGDAGLFAPAYAMSFSATTNTLFAVDKGTDESGFGTEGTIYEVNRTSGEATQTAFYNSGTVGNVFAISNAFVIPESSTFALLLPSLAILVGTPLVRTRIARRRIG